MIIVDWAIENPFLAVIALAIVVSGIVSIFHGYP